MQESDVDFFPHGQCIEIPRSGGMGIKELSEQISELQTQMAELRTTQQESLAAAAEADEHRQRESLQETRRGGMSPRRS